MQARNTFRLMQTLLQVGLAYRGIVGIHFVRRKTRADFVLNQSERSFVRMQPIESWTYPVLDHHRN